MRYLLIWSQKASAITVGASFRGDIETSLRLTSKILVMSEVPQGWILALILFNIFTNGLHDGTEGTIIKSADHAMLGEEVDTAEGRAAI